MLKVHPQTTFTQPVVVVLAYPVEKYLTCPVTRRNLANAKYFLPKWPEFEAIRTIDVLNSPSYVHFFLVPFTAQHTCSISLISIEVVIIEALLPISIKNTRDLTAF